MSDEISKLFLPQLFGKQELVQGKKTRFAHYTSAEGAMSILTTRKMWLRNILFMNDFSEVDFGIRCLSAFFNGTSANAFWEIVARLTDGTGQGVKDLFNGWVPDLTTQTYVTCVSEHGPEDDAYGRLSMWRAYGKNTGVALVVNPDVMLSETDALHTYTYPVWYGTEREAQDMFKEVVDGIVANESKLKSMTAQEATAHAFHMFHSFALCLKHRGFEEEREWRIIHRPKMQPSERVTPRTVSIGGVPQRIYEVPLADVPQEGLVGLSIPSLINRVIVGPTEYPVALWHAFVELLREAGVENPESKVFTSNIPLRV